VAKKNPTSPRIRDFLAGFKGLKRELRSAPKLHDFVPSEMAGKNLSRITFQQSIGKTTHRLSPKKML
jgi:hypothetical protein